MTTLTTAQILALKTAINADPTFAAFPLSGDGYYNLAQALSVEASPAFWVWSTTADVQLIRAAIAWANLTPTDVPDGTTIWGNRSLQCQGKQFNLQMIIPIDGTLNASDVNVRNGLQDALQNVRSGVAGASQDGGWVAVRNVLARKARYIEKILSDTTVGNGQTRPLSASLVYEGQCTDVMVIDARNS
jgi:hypothetical protein